MKTNFESAFSFEVGETKFSVTIVNNYESVELVGYEECRLLGCYALFIVTAVKTSNLT
jgi:hypothetical protein